MTGGVFVLRLVILVVQGRLFGLDIVTLTKTIRLAITFVWDS
jgi:hypothetical protein